MLRVIILRVKRAITNKRRDELNEKRNTEQNNRKLRTKQT